MGGVAAEETTVAVEVASWIEQNWDSTLTVAEWWRRLADAGLSHETLAPPWGRGWGRAGSAILAAQLANQGALGPPPGVGMMLAAPTLLAHGAPELIEAFVPHILNGQHAWCQLFSEPGAGSDLAGLTTRAERDGHEWVITGQKVWTSTADIADYGMLVARTDPDRPKHEGLTYFVLPMQQAGVEVRPLREMTGRAVFNEVFIDGARVPMQNMVGDLGSGWRVTMTTLTVERASIGAGAMAAPSAARPGKVAADLDRPVGDFLGKAIDTFPTRAPTVEDLAALAKERGLLGDLRLRQDLARLHTLVEINRWHGGRGRAGSAKTGGEGTLPSSAAGRPSGSSGRSAAG